MTRDKYTVPNGGEISEEAISEGNLAVTGLPAGISDADRDVSRRVENPSSSASLLTILIVRGQCVDSSVKSTRERIMFPPALFHRHCILSPELPTMCETDIRLLSSRLLWAMLPP